ncbi:hypothetical protein ACM66B_001221 [Microbotryomycetes sp. NB124-2]
MIASLPSTPDRAAQANVAARQIQVAQPLVALVWRRHSFSGASYIQPVQRVILPKCADPAAEGVCVVAGAPSPTDNDLSQTSLLKKDGGPLKPGPDSVDGATRKLGKMLFRGDKASTADVAPTLKGDVLYETGTSLEEPAKLDVVQPRALAPPFEPRPTSEEQQQHIVYKPFNGNALGIHVDGVQYPYTPCSDQLVGPPLYVPPHAILGPPTPDYYMSPAQHRDHTSYYPITKDGVSKSTPSGPTMLSPAPALSPPHAMLFSPPYMPYDLHPAGILYQQPPSGYSNTPPSPHEPVSYQGELAVMPSHLYPTFASNGADSSPKSHLVPMIGSFDPTVARRLEEGAVLRRTGVTKFFDLQKGFGFIVDDNVADISYRDIFVHYTAIMMKSGFRCLHTDEAVEYDLVKASNGGYQALNVCGPQGRQLQGLLSHESARLAALADGKGRKLRVTVGVNSVTPRTFPRPLSASPPANKTRPKSIVVSLPTPTSSRAGSAPPTPSADADDY